MSRLEEVTESHSIPTTGWGALHHAAYHGHTEIGRALLDAGAIVEAEGRFPGTPITQAARMGHADFVRLLLDHGADPALAMVSATPYLACMRVLVRSR
jgi:ankyrin repeat protein